jgi:hypothetical protein
VSPSDVHLRVKQHSDGIIVGVTSSYFKSTPAPPPPTLQSSNTTTFATHTSGGQHHHHHHHQHDEGVASDAETLPRNPRLRTPAEDVCPADDDSLGASERLLGNQNRYHGDRGTMNPVFVDEHEDGEGQVVGRGREGEEREHH